MVNWYISKKNCGSTKSKIVPSPHYLKILIKLAKHDPRSISEITFLCQLRHYLYQSVYTELYLLQKMHYLCKSIQLNYCCLNNKQQFLKNIPSSISIGLTLKLARNVILEIYLGSRLRLYLSPCLVNLIKFLNNVGLILLFIWYFHKKNLRFNSSPRMAYFNCLKTYDTPCSSRIQNCLLDRIS